MNLFNYFDDLDTFNTKKISANKFNNSYFIFNDGDGLITNGTPDILFESICFINDELLIWTHGTFYSGMDFSKFDDISADKIVDGVTNKVVTQAEKDAWDSKTDNVGTITSVKTTAGKHTAVNISNGNVSFNVPTSTEHLDNDSGFLTSSNAVTSFNGQTGSVTYTAPVKSVNSMTGDVTIDLSSYAKSSLAIGSLTLGIDSSTYKVTLSGKKVDGTSFTVDDVIDLPLESMVVNGSFDSTTKKILLLLKSGSNVEFSVADLVSGLLSEITTTNKLSADLLKDGNENKLVTQAEKAYWNAMTSNTGTVTGVKMNSLTKSPENGIVDLGTVITDISSKQDTIADLSTIRSGALSGATAYLKPNDGIPKTDLATAVQTSLGKADTALLSFTETDPTVPSWAKAANKPTYTASEVGAVPTSREVNGKALSQDITLTASDVNALPDTTVIPDELKDLTDDSGHRLVTDTEKQTWNAKQDALVSGTNIKTINGNTILGSGDVSIPSSTITFRLW